MGTTVKAVSPGAMELILRHHWPGNIRELENTIQRGIVLTGSQYIEESHLSSRLLEHTENNEKIEDIEPIQSLKIAQKQLEKRMIQNALVSAGGNKSKAARALDISYPSLLSKIKEYKL